MTPVLRGFWILIGWKIPSYCLFKGRKKPFRWPGTRTMPSRWIWIPLCIQHWNQRWCGGRHRKSDRVDAFLICRFYLDLQKTNISPFQMLVGFDYFPFEMVPFQVTFVHFRESTVWSTGILHLHVVADMRESQADMRESQADMRESVAVICSHIRQLKGFPASQWLAGN